MNKNISKLYFIAAVDKFFVGKNHIFKKFKKKKTFLFFEPHWYEHYKQLFFFYPKLLKYIFIIILLRYNNIGKKISILMSILKSRGFPTTVSH